MQSQVPTLVDQRVCVKARQVLLLKWLLVTFFITMSYKQVLLANLVDIGYEETIETLDELVNSGKPLVGQQNVGVPIIMAMDPRTSVKKLLAERMLWYNFTGQTPKWIQEG